MIYCGLSHLLNMMQENLFQFEYFTMFTNLAQHNVGHKMEWNAVLWTMNPALFLKAKTFLFIYFIHILSMKHIYILLTVPGET